MATDPNTLPELDSRLQARRAELADTLGRLKQKVTRSAHDLSPRRQLKRHPEVALSAAGFAGLAVGYATARLLRGLARWLV